MSRLLAAALILSVVTLALSVHTLVLTISGEASIIDAFLAGLTGGKYSLIMLSTPILAILSLMLSLIARREAESIIDTSINYVEEFEGKVSLALSYLALSLSAADLIIILVQLTISGLGLS